MFVNYMAYGTRRFTRAPIISILSRINLITRIDTYLFKVHSNIVLPSTNHVCYIGRNVLTYRA